VKPRSAGDFYVERLFSELANFCYVSGTAHRDRQNCAGKSPERTRSGGRASHLNYAADCCLLAQDWLTKSPGFTSFDKELY